MSNLNEIKEHWENEETVSLKDKNLQILERKIILEHLEQIQPLTVADIGCGTGEDTIYFSKYCKKLFAFDYSSAMLKKAKKNLENEKNIVLNELNILENDIKGNFDTVITKRMLINLGSFENQMMAIKKIHNSLNENGYFIMLETSSDGLKKLNNLRTKFNLEPIQAPFHNNPFPIEELKNELMKYFTIEKISNFSTYFFLTRVYNPLVNEKDYFKLDAIAKNIAENTKLFESEIIGPQFCLLLKKK